MMDYLERLTLKVLSIRGKREKTKCIFSNIGYVAPCGLRFFVEMNHLSTWERDINISAMKYTAEGGFLPLPYIYCVSRVKNISRKWVLQRSIIYTHLIPKIVETFIILSLRNCVPI